MYTTLKVFLTKLKQSDILLILQIYRLSAIFDVTVDAISAIFAKLLNANSLSGLKIFYATWRLIVCFRTNYYVI